MESIKNTLIFFALVAAAIFMQPLSTATAETVTFTVTRILPPITCGFKGIQQTLRFDGVTVPAPGGVDLATKPFSITVQCTGPASNVRVKTNAVYTDDSDIYLLNTGSTKNFANVYIRTSSNKIVKNGDEYPLDPAANGGEATLNFKANLWFRKGPKEQSAGSLISSISFILNYD